jgi:hypothetical protein
MILSRRSFLVSASALAIVPALPSMFTAAPATAATIGPATTIWVGGHAGEFDWHPFAAKTKKDALRELMNYHGYGSPEEIELMLELPEDEVASILKADDLEISRAPKMDGLQPDDIKPHHWIRAGLGACCDRCSYECYDGDGGRAIGTECICEECLTLSDLVNDGDIDDAVEKLAEHLAENDFDREGVTAFLAMDNDMSVITEEIWARAMEDAREYA